MYEENFWIVWNPDRGLPRMKHATPELARAEAERLANQHPGQKFFVLAAIGSAQSTNVVWRPVDDIPF